MQVFVKSGGNSQRGYTVVSFWVSLFLVKGTFYNESLCVAVEKDVNVDGDDGFKGPMDPAVMSTLLPMSRGCHVYFGFEMELATGQGCPDSYFRFNVSLPASLVCFTLNHEMTHFYSNLIRAVLYMAISTQSLSSCEIQIRISFIIQEYLGNIQPFLPMNVSFCICMCGCSRGQRGGEAKCSNSCNPPCLIQQLLYSEVRALDPLMWPLWRGVNQQQ